MDKGNGGIIPPDGGYGWIIVLSTTIINICVLPLVQCFGIIFSDELEKATEISFLLHLHSAIYCSLGLFSSPLLKIYDFRKVALFGTTLMCIGIFSTSFAKSYGVLIFTISIIIGVGQGILLPATYLATNTYFKKRLTLAVTFSVTGAGVSTIFMAQLCRVLLQKYGRKYTVLTLSFISITAILACFLLRPLVKKKESQLEALETLNPDNLEKNNGVYRETTIGKTNNNDFLSRINNMFNLELLKERQYVVAIILMAISFASELNIILMLPFVLKELSNFDVGKIAIALSVQSTADICGRLIVPIGGHLMKISAIVMYCGSLIVASLGRTGITIFYESDDVLIYSCVAILGLAKGVKAVYQSVIIPKLVTLEKLPAANGLNMLLTGALSLVLGPIIGLVHDMTESYIYAVHTASILSLSCVIIWILNYYYTRGKNSNNHIQNGAI